MTTLRLFWTKLEQPSGKMEFVPIPERQTTHGFCREAYYISGLDIRIVVLPMLPEVPLLPCHTSRGPASLVVPPAIQR